MRMNFLLLLTGHGLVLLLHDLAVMAHVRTSLSVPGPTASTATIGAQIPHESLAALGLKSLSVVVFFEPFTVICKITTAEFRVGGHF